MDLQGYPLSDRGRFEKVINQFFVKSLHIILDSRIPVEGSTIKSLDIIKTDKWFNLVLGDHPVAMESMNFLNRGLMEPMIIDIIITQGSHSGLTSEIFTEKIIERWIIQYELRRLINPHSGDATSYRKTYKKSIILLRSVFSMLRLLPAYKAFRKVRSLKQSCDFDIRFQVCSFASMFSRKEEESMKKYIFFPVDAQHGCLSVSVVYREDLSEFNLDSCLACPPEIIPEYVGSPLADPMRSFPSSSSGNVSRGRRYSSHQRPYSWSSGLHKDAYGPAYSGSPPLFPSPSPTEAYPIIYQNERFSGHHRAESDDFVSPPFSSSPSASPPTCFSGGNRSHGYGNLETSPMSIPHPILSRSPRYLSPSFSDPNSRHSLPPLSPRSTRFDPSSNESTSGIRGIRRLHSLRSGELSSVSSNVGPLVYPDAREDSSCLPSTNSSPRIGLSRSSSRHYFQEDAGDCDFSCPFVVDDVDPPDSLPSRSPVKKSQDAVGVGALFHLLKTASPLRQDSSYRSSNSSNIQHDRVASEFFKPRTTSEALDELKSYKEMKHVLLSKSASHLQGKGKSMS